MSHVLAQVRLPNNTGLPGDVTVNSFSFDADPDSVEDHLAISAAVISFYNTAEATNSVAYYLSSVLDRSVDACQVELYDMLQPEPRVPIAGYTFQLETFGSPTSYPNEVALCTSYAAVGQAGSPMARRRGRIFLGPLTTATGVTQGNVATRVAAACITDIVASTRALAEDSAADGVPWCVWSRVDSTIRPVVRGWVDNDFDTQRRRQSPATARTNWSLSV